MTDSEQTRIFAKNLRSYVDASGKQQKEIAKDLGFAYQTFNGWCKGVSFPSMDKVQKIADYFRIGKTDLLDEKHDFSQDPFYMTLGKIIAKMNERNREHIANVFIKALDNPDIEKLLEIAVQSNPDNIKQAVDYLTWLKSKDKKEE